MLNESNIPLEEDGIEEEILVEEELTITKAMWGDIGGNIANQTDLQNALDAKQDDLTEAQLNAVNSGITAEKVTTYDGYADQIASKANQSALNAEATTREQADTALGTRIDNEALARQQADNGLQTQIDAITSKSDVVDVVANYAALQAYDTSTLSDKDVVKVLDDETHEDALTYYRWSVATQTWSYIGQEAPYYSKGQMDVKLAEKQDKLTAGTNIQIQNGTISATDTTYTAGNGLNLNGTEFSADTDVLATKEDLEGYYAKPETDNLLAPKLEAELVAELPSTGAEGKLYLTPKAHTTQTATGNPITISLGEDAGQITSAQLDGDTYQQSYDGKNIIDYITGLIASGGGLTNTINSDGTITTTGKPNGNYNIIIEYYGLTPFLEDGATYTLSSTLYDNKTAAQVRRMKISDSSTYSYDTLDGAKSFTVDKSQYTYRMGILTNTMSAWGDESLTITKGYQLEKSATATTFEPYVGGTASPNPDYPQAIQTVTGEQTVEVVGKNLFDTTNANIREQYILNDSGVEVSDRSGGYTRNYSKVVPETTYILSGLDTISGKTRRIYYYNKDKTFISRSAQITTGSPTLTFTTPANCYFVNIQIFYPNDTDTSAWQLELGSTATAYTPYSKQTLPIDLGNIELNGLGDDGNGSPLYKDRIYKDGPDWKVHKEIGSQQFDGSESWSKSIATANNVYIGVNARVHKDSPVLSDKLTVYQASYMQNNSIIGIAYNTTGGDEASIRISTSLSGASDLTTFKSWLSSTKPTAYYALATTTDTTITDQTLIAQLEAIRTALLQNGANTITNTATGSNLAGDMEIGYYSYNPRNRYDKWLWLDINNEYEQIGS